MRSCPNPSAPEPADDHRTASVTPPCQRLPLIRRDGQRSHRTHAPKLPIVDLAVTVGVHRGEHLSHRRERVAEERAVRVQQPPQLSYLGDQHTLAVPGRKGTRGAFVSVERGVVSVVSVERGGPWRSPRLHPAAESAGCGRGSWRSGGRWRARARALMLRRARWWRLHRVPRRRGHCVPQLRPTEHQPTQSRARVTPPGGAQVAADVAKIDYREGQRVARGGTDATARL
jgi:hypothetical protein